MLRKPLYPALLAASGLVALLAGTSTAAAAADAAWIEARIEQMLRQEGVARQDMSLFTSTLMQAYETRTPGRYFDTYPPNQIAEVAEIYGQVELATALRNWQLTQGPHDRFAGDSAAVSNDATPSGSLGHSDAMLQDTTLRVGEAAGSGTAPATPTSHTMQMDPGTEEAFIGSVLRNMQMRASISREDVARFESLLRDGRGQDVLQRFGYANAADLVALYGLNNLSTQLRSHAQVAAGSRSAAARLGSVTSSPEHAGDYRAEYLAKANSFSPAGVGRYGGAKLTVFSEHLEPYVLDDPIAGEQVRNNVTSCLYRGSAPAGTMPRPTNTMQLLDLPGAITATRFVRHDTETGEDIIESYVVSRVALDWGVASDTRVTAYFYGNILPPPVTEEDAWGQLVTYQPPAPPPQWQVFACSPRAIRS